MEEKERMMREVDDIEKQNALQRFNRLAPTGGDPQENLQGAPTGYTHSDRSEWFLVPNSLLWSMTGLPGSEECHEERDGDRCAGAGGISSGRSSISGKTLQGNVGAEATEESRLEEHRALLILFAPSCIVGGSDIRSFVLLPLKGTAQQEADNESKSTSEQD
eukprot:763911-Hanusia_phi.AAC.2